MNSGWLGLPRLFMVEPRELGDLFSGSRVMVVGRYEGLGADASQIWEVWPVLGVLKIS